MLPFTPVAFFDVFTRYNAAIWPAQVVAYALGLAAVVLLLRAPGGFGLGLAAILAAMWLWTGVAYHWLFFAAINPAARLFAGLFVVEGLLIAACPLLSKPAGDTEHGPIASVIGWGLIGYSLALYPLINLATGHPLGSAPSFGVTPCPVTIFTFGVFVQARPLIWLLAIPVIWSVIGGSAAFLIGIPSDWLLLASGPAAVGLASTRRPMRRH